MGRSIIINSLLTVRQERGFLPRFLIKMIWAVAGGIMKRKDNSFQEAELLDSVSLP